MYRVFGMMLARAAELAPPSLLRLYSRYRGATPLRAARRVFVAGLADAAQGMLVRRGPLRGMRLAFDPEGDANGPTRWLGIHEPEVQRTASQFLRPGDVVFDVGAHIGFYVLLFARRVVPGGRIYAFEPDPQNAALLRKNIALNSLDAVTEVRETAVGESVTRGHIVRALSSGETSVSPDASGGVHITTLDVEVFERGAPSPRLILIDTEGAEQQVLAGARRVLREGRPIVIAEHHGRSRELIEHMTNYGYRGRPLDDRHLLFEANSQADDAGSAR